MDSPHILTRSQKKQLGDMEASNNILPNEFPSGDKTAENPIKKLLLEENLKSHEVQSPAKRLQPSRLSKNPVTPSKTTGDKGNIKTDQSTTLSQNKIVGNNDALSNNIPNKLISLWKPCESPKVHILSTIHENGKENISLEDEGTLIVKDSTLLTPIREDRRTSMRIRRRSTSVSPTRTSQPRIMTRRSMRSLSESKTFPDSPSIEACIPLISCNKSDNNNLENLKSIKENPTTNSSSVAAKDKCPKESAKVTAEQKTLPNDNVTNLEPLKTIQKEPTINTSAEDKNPKQSTKATSEQKTVPNEKDTNLELLKTIQENATTNSVTGKDKSPNPPTKVTAEQKTLPNVNVDNLKNLKTIEKEPTINTSAEDKSPKPSTKATSEQKTLPNVNVDNFKTLKTIQKEPTTNTSVEDKSPNPPTKVTAEQKTLPNVNVDNLKNLKTIQKEPTTYTSAEDKSPKPSTKGTAEQKTLPNVNVDNVKNLKTIQKAPTTNTSAEDKSPKPSTKGTAEQKTLPNVNVDNVKNLKIIQKAPTTNTSAEDKSPKPSTKGTAEQKTLPNVNVDNLKTLKIIQKEPTTNTSAEDKSPKPSTKGTAEQKTLPNVNVDNVKNLKTIQKAPTTNTSAEDKSPKPSTKGTAEQKTLPNVNVDNLKTLKIIQKAPTTNTSAEDKSPKPSTKVTAEQKTLPNVNVDNLKTLKIIQKEPTTNTSAEDKSPKPSTKGTAEQKTIPNVNVDNLKTLKIIQKEPTTYTSAEDKSPKPSTKGTAEQKTLSNMNVDNLKTLKIIQKEPTTNTSAEDTSSKPSTKVIAEQKALPNVNIDNVKNLKTIQKEPTTNTSNITAEDTSSKPSTKVIAEQKALTNKNVDNVKNLKTIQKEPTTNTSNITAEDTSSKPSTKVIAEQKALTNMNVDNVNNLKTIQKEPTTNTSNITAEDTSSKPSTRVIAEQKALTNMNVDNVNTLKTIQKEPTTNTSNITAEDTSSKPSTKVIAEQKALTNMNVDNVNTLKTIQKEPTTNTSNITAEDKSPKPSIKVIAEQKALPNVNVDNLENLKTIRKDPTTNTSNVIAKDQTQQVLKEHSLIKSKTPLRPNSGLEKLQNELTKSNTTKDKLNHNVSEDEKTPQIVRKSVKLPENIKLVSTPVVCNEKQSDIMENKMDITDKENEDNQKESKSINDCTIIKANDTKLDDINKKNDNSSKTGLEKKNLVISESKTTEPHLEVITSQKTLTNIKNVSNKGDNQKTTLEPTETVNQNLIQKETLVSKVARNSSVPVIESNKKYMKKSDDCFINSSQKMDNEFLTTQVSESSENSKVTLVQLESSVCETQSNNVEYLGTHRLFCELLEDSPKKDLHNTNDNKVSNYEIKPLSGVIKKQFGTEDLEQSGKQENLKKSSEKLKVGENESSSDSDSNVTHLDTIEETVENDLTKNDFKAIKSNYLNVEQNKEKIVNVNKNSFGMNMKTILYEYSHDNDVNTKKQNEETKNKKHCNRRTRKNKIGLQAQKQNDEKVEASIETCSLILRVKNDSSEENVVVFDNKTSKSVKRSYDELEEYDNINNVNIQQEKKEKINKKSKKNKTAKHTDNIVKIKNETTQEVKNVSSHEKNIPESITSNKRLHDQSDVDKQDKKKIKMVKSQENAQSNLPQVKQNSEKIDSPRTQRNYRKMMITFKKTLKNIDFTELLELLTIPIKNEHVKMLNLNQNDLRKLKAKILQSTEYKTFASKITKEKVTSDTKLSAKQKNDALYKFNINKPNAIGNFNQKKNYSKSNIQSEKSESSKQMNNEPELLNTGQSIKLSKKKRKNRSKSKKNIPSLTNEPVSMKGINFNSKAEMNKVNQLETGQFQAKPKQNKPEFGKVIDQPTASSKDKLINQRQEFKQQVKWKPKIEEKIQLRINKESDNESLALKRENVSVFKFSGKSVERKLRDEGTHNNLEKEPKHIIMKQDGNKSQNKKNQKKKIHKMAVQPTILKTSGCLFKVETLANSNKTGDQRKTNTKDTKMAVQPTVVKTSGCLFKVETSANSNKTGDQRKTNSKDTKEPSGFKVHVDKGRSLLNTEKTILQSNENSEDFRSSKEYKAGLKLMTKTIDTNNVSENNMFTFFKKPKKCGTEKGPKDDGQTQKKAGIKRLPSELLEALTDEPIVKKKKDVETAESVQASKKKKKKLKLKSAILEESYIPLTTDGATQFVVARLDKEAPLTSAQQAANFRNNQLYGPFNRRVSAKQLHNTKQKYKANNKE